MAFLNFKTFVLKYRYSNNFKTIFLTVQANCANIFNTVYIREGVLKRSIVYLSWKNRLLQIFYDLASEVMNEGKYSSEDQGLD